MMLRKFLACDAGATALEYGVIAGLIGIVLVTTVTSVGSRLDALFETVQTGLASAH